MAHAPGWRDDAFMATSDPDGPTGRAPAGARNSPIEVLERWERHGALWRVRHVSDELAIVDLRTCHGEPVDRLESHDPELIEYLRRTVREGL
jgi:hypothetical protein